MGIVGLVLLLLKFGVLLFVREYDDKFWYFDFIYGWSNGFWEKCCLVKFIDFDYRFDIEDKCDFELL